MPSLNGIMNKWHAYSKVGGKRKHLGYYDNKADAIEAEQLGEKTDKAWSAHKRAEGKAERIVNGILYRRVNVPEEEKPKMPGSEQREEPNRKLDDGPSEEILTPEPNDSGIEFAKLSGHFTFCAYCGDYYECDDHIIPLAVASGLRNRNGTLKRNAFTDTGKTIPCCDMCNNALGEYYIITIRDRVSFLLSHYKTKYKKVAGKAEWTPEEVDELGKNLKGHVLNTAALTYLINAKIANLELVNAGGLALEIKASI